MIIQCCVCKKIKLAGDTWEHLPISEKEAANASHTYCPGCYEAAKKEIADYHNSKK